MLTIVFLLTWLSDYFVIRRLSFNSALTWVSGYRSKQRRAVRRVLLAFLDNLGQLRS